jgi:transposase
MRSKIVLGWADGWDNKQVAEQVRCSPATVGKWRRRFIEHRLDGLLDEARPGRPRTISVDQVEEVIVATLESTPPNATHWTQSKMARRSGLSKTTIGKIWKDFGLKPHRVDHFKLSTDPLFIDKLYDVVGLYLHPPEAAVVLCVDEKSQVQALQRSQPAFPMMPGMPEKRTHDYVRHGTTTLFAAMNVADGTVISSLHRRHRAVEFKKFLTKIDDQVPADLEVHPAGRRPKVSHTRTRVGSPKESRPPSTWTESGPTPILRRSSNRLRGPGAPNLRRSYASSSSCGAAFE